jgi:hypothetical protein
MATRPVGFGVVRGPMVSRAHNGPVFMVNR